VGHRVPSGRSPLWGLCSALRKMGHTCRNQRRGVRGSRQPFTALATEPAHRSKGTTAAPEPRALLGRRRRQPWEVSTAAVPRAVPAPAAELRGTESAGCRRPLPLRRLTLQTRIFPSAQSTAGSGAQLVQRLPCSAFPSLLCHFKAALARALLKLCKALLVRGGQPVFITPVLKHTLIPHKSAAS